MMADKENILERLKKLLALSKSDNPHEFAQALQRIQELMQIDHITCNDIGLNCIDSSYWVAGSVNQPREGANKSLI
ncbi:DUF2786 domain-containing protein [Enterobacter sp. EC_64]|nr:DUF2786 domain-containing protein [Enterobacter sp. EC_64]